MALEEGTYVIVSAKNHAFALDVTGGSDDMNGRRVQLYERNDSDAQLVRVIADGSGYRLVFVLSGKALDRDGNGSADGTIVQQWDSYGGAAQKWEVKEDGKTANVGGASIPSYTIGNFGVKTSVLDIVSGQIASGTRLQMYTANGTDAQRWAFVPMPSVPDGTYIIRTALDRSVVLDVAGGSAADGANVQIYGENDTNAQKWVVKNNSDGTCSIRNASTGKALDVDVSADRDGKNVQQWSPSSTQQNQKWVCVQGGSAKSNGVLVPLYVIHSQSSSGRVLDVADGSMRAQTNVQVWTANGTRAQLFEFEPTEYVASNLPIPTGGRLATVAGGFSSSPIVIGQEATVYPSWLCRHDAFSVRYRTRTRGASRSNGDIGQWGEWKSIRDGSSSNAGWGNIREPNVAEPVSSGSSRWATDGIGVSFGAYDRMDVQFEVRSFATSWGDAGGTAHGNPATFTVVVAKEASLSDVQVAFTPEGLRVGYVSSFKRGGNSLNVAIEGVADLHPFSGLGSSGSVTIPIGDMKRVPEEGESLTVTMQITTCDAAMDYVTKQVSMSYDAGHGTTLSQSVRIDGVFGTLETDATRAWLLVPRGHGDRFVDIDMKSKTFLPPIGVRYRLFLVKDAGDSWATKMVSMGAVDDCGYHITSKDMSHDFAIYAGDGGDGGPSFSMKYKRDSDTKTTTGRERNVVSFGETVAATGSLDGYLVEDSFGGVFEEQKSRFDAMAHDGYAYLRTPLGMWMQIAVTDSGIGLGKKGESKVSVGFTEVEW